MTYSIVARDAETGELGVAVQSHWFSVGSRVCWAEAGVGAVATQAFSEPSYGPLALGRLRSGAAATDALAELVAADEGRALRQVAVVDSCGGAAAHTGSSCVVAAGHRAGGGASAQGNMLRSDEVWQAMLPALETASGPLAERLLAALEAAEAAGGDIRGRQSAALLVVGGERSERPWEGVLVNVRVDDHPAPLPELRRLLELHRAYAGIAAALRDRILRVDDGAGIGPGDLDTAVQELVAAQMTLAENVEPTVWRAVLLARAGRLDDARSAAHEAFAINPDLAEFVRRLTKPGFLSAEQAAALADGAAS